MIWHVSLSQLGLVVVVFGISCVLIARRRRETREGSPVILASRGGSPMWIWVVLAVWTCLSVLLGIALLLTGHAVIDY